MTLGDDVLELMWYAGNIWTLILAVVLTVLGAITGFPTALLFRRKLELGNR